MSTVALNVQIDSQVIQLTTEALKLLVDVQTQ